MSSGEEMTTIKVKKSTADKINSIRSLMQLRGESVTNEDIVLDAVIEVYKTELNQIEAFLSKDGQE